MPRWLTIILGAVAIVAVVLGFRAMMPGGQKIATVQAETVPTLDKPMAATGSVRDGMQVVVRRSVAEVRPLFLTLSGRSEAARTATVKSETSGTVVSAPAVEGRQVDKGDILCGLDGAARAAKVREADAAAAQKQLDYNAAVELQAKGWASPARVDITKAALDSAKAALEVAKLDFAKTQIRAPFPGVFEKRLSDVGDFMSPGTSCGTVVELDPIVVIGEASEKSAGLIHLDAPAKLKLADGSEASGSVRYVAKTADPQTRAYRVEVEVANHEGSIPVGRIAEVRIQTGQGDAHKVNPALLTTDDQGRIGVRYLDVGGVVSFAPADVVDETPDGVWITGLPHETLIVAEGQDGVKPGLRVTPVIRDAAR
ncbi:MAG: efflux RND transporter periplasmic adaptor subunit [Alphaproteobacteria bacterium]|nr:efflux RND transporter periplasmic adaptor subunit [Alphaproteobacteria bacterium]